MSSRGRRAESNKLERGEEGKGQEAEDVECAKPATAWVSSKSTKDLAGYALHEAEHHGQTCDSGHLSLHDCLETHG
ncbi:unnamed protein product [Clonostachys rosea f. rosea IK726]|uniref:Uncharacterized protein n=1 Tax=Clonostachys rosea f. rosea IK726 TaxID=1349383 RepID=A0ACA9TUR0_BIOOC|nr:unnamed protein product [Clonostachys rosea f. rosea IK726]